MEMVKIKENEIVFYNNEKGKNEVKEYIEKLNSTKNNNKDNRIKFNKIISYIRMLKSEGILLGEPYIKHIKNEIWELRPLRDRIFFANINNNKFVLLSVYVKRTKKTPKLEIKKAEEYFKKYINRGD